MLQLCVCRYIERLGSLESTQEARVSRGAHLRPFLALETFRLLNISTYAR